MGKMPDRKAKAESHEIRGKLILAGSLGSRLSGELLRWLPILTND
jgi:hypothetical protein